MHRPGMDESNARPQDFLCDFCHAPWSESRPMVEGHRGALVCGACLTLAFDALWNRGQGEGVAESVVCTMCLSHNGDPVYRSPAFPDALICKRCAKQAAVMLERDPESGWSRPTK